MTPLNRKLLREMLRMRGQIVTIALVLASGIVCYISMRGTYESLAAAQIAYYDRFRFAHVFARAERAPETLASRIEALPGVETAQTRIVEEVTLPIEGMDRPAYGELLSLSEKREPRTNALNLRKGRYPERGNQDEVLLLESFAKAHGLEPNQRVPVVINGTKRSLRVVGTALSPEFAYSIRPGVLMDDPKRHAVLWMDKRALASAFQLEGAFNDVTLRLSPGASEQAVREALDRLLKPYGGSYAFGRKDHASHRMLTQELDQLRMLSTMVPAVFLGVAAFLVNMVLGRLIRLQRAEVATLKAIGYADREIARHYLGLVLIVLLPGNLLGIICGALLGELLLEVYSELFRLPDLLFRLGPSMLASAVFASAVAAVLGALMAVRAAIKMPPAEAMQPPAPARYRRSLLERFGLAAIVGTSAMMVLREIARRPLRTLGSAIGISGAVSLLILSHFGLDSLLSYFEGTYRREQRQDLAVVFDRPAPPRVARELGRMPGVLTAEGLHMVPVRVRHEHRSRDSLMTGLPRASTLRRVVGRGGHAVEMPEGGVIVNKTLGEILGLRIGDRLDVEVREGERRTVRPVVMGFVDESVGLQLYAESDAIATLEGDHGAISQVLLKVDPQAKRAIEQKLARSPRVLEVSDVTSDMQRLLDMNASVMDIWTALSVALSTCVVFGVVYNNARIALAARSRDLATLRVLGFTRREISWILLGGQAVEVLFAIPLGLGLGYLWALQFMKSVDQETFRWAVVIAPRTYLLASAVTLLAAAGSALWVRRSLDTLDLLSVLKARE